jgi:hypothetical protein
VLPLAAATVAVARIWAGALLFVLFAIFVFSVARFPYFSPTGLVEEAAYTYTSAENYLRFGFLNSLLLQDFSTSSHPGDHPFIYNHMPPGPDLLVALLLKMTGHSYRITRFLLASMSLAGIAVYLTFAGMVFARLGFGRYGALAVLFLMPHDIFSNFDRHNTVLLPLLMFGPVVALQAYYRNGRRWLLLISIVGAFLSSIYLEYIALSAVLFSWILLYLTQLLRVDRRHVIAVVVAIVSGIAAHLVQNAVYLGAATFWRELEVLLSNRAFGYPTKAELKTFYRSIAVVHHGSHPFRLHAFVGQLVAGFRFPAYRILGLTAMAALTYSLVLPCRYRADLRALVWRKDMSIVPQGSYLRLVVWAGAAITLPLLLFPAFAQEVSLHGNGTNLFFISIVATAIMLGCIRLVVECLPPWLARRGRPDGHDIVQTVVWLAVAVSVVLVFRSTVREHVRSVRSIVQATEEYPNRALGDIRERFAGSLYMTNISAVTVGFLVQEAGWGVCSLAAVPADGDIRPEACDSFNIRRPERYADVRPRYFFFFWSPDLFPGYSDCLPSGYFPSDERGGDACIATLYRRLTGRFEKVFENQLVIVFDLGRRLSG